MNTICQHREIVGYQDGKLLGTCQKCGQVKQYDPAGHDKPFILKEGKAMNKVGKRRYYKEHREEILNDVRLLGRPAACKKWGIASSTWHQLMQRWLPAADLSQVVEPHQDYPQGNITPAKPIEPRALPALPEFSEAWDGKVKLAWLECFSALTKHNI